LKKQTKTENIHIRITPKLKRWLKKNKFSPTNIFKNAVSQLGFKEDK